MARVIVKSFSRPDNDTQALYDVDLELSPQFPTIVPAARLYRAQTEAAGVLGYPTRIMWTKNGDEAGFELDEPFLATVGPIEYLRGPLELGNNFGYVGFLFGGTGDINITGRFFLYGALLTGQTFGVDFLINGVVAGSYSCVWGVDCPFDAGTPFLLASDTMTVTAGDVLIARHTSGGDYIDKAETTISGISLITDGSGPTEQETFESTTNVLVVTGLAETLAPGCDLTAIGSPSRVIVSYGISTSENRFGVPKEITLRLRRTNLTGAILASAVWVAGTDSTTGHDKGMADVYVDVAPTDGRYVLTVQETDGDALTEVWSGARMLRLYY